jgi:hypothetical protein
MTVSKQKQAEIDARTVIREHKKQDREQRLYANKEGNRLNRLYAKEFRHNKLLKTLSVEIENKDNHNAVLDKLHALVWYTYHKNGFDLRIMRPHVKKLLEAPAKTPKQPQSDRPVLTRDALLDYLYYDPARGTFEINTGEHEGKLKTYIQNEKRKEPRKDRSDSTKLRPKNYVPTHSGYYQISEQAYLTAIGRGKTDVYKRSYHIRVPKKATSAIAAERVYYYLRQTAAFRVISVPITHSTYSAANLAYLCMGAGGDWDYSQGIDHAYRVNTDRAPQGMRYYSMKTNKPIKIPCRDGDKLNVKWDNIKPYEVGEPQYIPPSQVAHIPMPPKAPTPTPAQRKTYGYEANIKETYRITAPTTPCYTLHNMGNPPYFNYEYGEAKAEFLRRLNALPGHKQLLRNGKVMVTVPAKGTVIT